MKLYLIPFIILIITSSAFSGCRDKPRVDRASLEKIVDNYCSDVAAGNYSNAYDMYLNSAYKKDITLDDFTAAHKKRKETYGVLLEKKATFMTSTKNLFSGLREYQFTFELKYKDKTVHEVVKLNDEDGKFLIEGTYTYSSSDTLRFMVW